MAKNTPVISFSISSTLFFIPLCFSSYPQQQFTQQGNPGQFAGPMMMNGSMGGPGPVSGAGGAQMGMNSMGMGRMPMGPEQVDGLKCVNTLK